MTVPSSFRIGRPRLRLWHVLAFSAFVAVAAANIRDQRIDDPALVALAAVGFLGYLTIGVLAWRRFVAKATGAPDPARRGRLLGGESRALIAYVLAMSAFFLVATVAYLAIERIRKGY